jgi:hypothetical protein
MREARSGRELLSGRRQRRRKLILVLNCHNGPETRRQRGTRLTGDAGMPILTN